MTPPDPADAPLFDKVPVPPELLAWAKATADEEDVLALLAEAQAQGGYSMEDMLPELERLFAPPE